MHPIHLKEHQTLSTSGYLKYPQTVNPNPCTKKHSQDAVITEKPSKKHFLVQSTFQQECRRNVGKHLLSLVDQHFPKSNPLHKIFNWNTLKLSYSCTGNIKSIISNHDNAQINKSDTTNDNNCNCHNPNTCPMDGNCNDMNIIYQAEISTPTAKETYIGLIRHDLQAKISKSHVFI